MPKKKAKLKNGTKAIAKPASQVSVAPCPWDLGASGPANTAREQQIEDASEPEVDPETGEIVRRNPNGVIRLRFYDMLDVYHRRGVISHRGYEAGKKLRAAWEKTQRGVGMDWSQDRVDRTPKPDVQVAIQVDRLALYSKIKGRVARDDADIVMAVARDGQPVGFLRRYRALNHAKGLDHLAAALDRLADRMGM